MKSIKIFATAGAIALLGMAGLSSCKTNNGPEGPSNYNGEVVKTQFTISIPEIKNAGTPAGAPGVLRMPAANTQESGFLGMEDIVLMPFITTVSGTPASSGAVVGSDTRLGDKISLGAIAASGDGSLLSGSGTTKYKVYSDVSIPLRTNHFLLYAKGKTTATPSENLKFEEGLLNHTSFDGTNFTPSSITFSLQQICSNIGDEGANLCAFLTQIANANSGSTAGEHDEWKEHENENILGLYNSFIAMQAGSATSVLAALEDLYNSLDVYNEAYNASHSNDDAVVKAVMNKIETKVTMTGTTTGLKEAQWNSASFATYPTNLNLPDGAAAIAWKSASNEFEVATTYAWQAANTNETATIDVAKMTDYVYPSCLYYYVNSGLKTAPNTPLAANATEIASKSWGEVLSSYYNYENNISVNTNTRSVAIINPVQYSVARLKTSVKAGAATIKDKIDNDMDVTKFQMTAVLVGGQGSVGFDFIPTGTGEKIIYDKALAYTTNVATEYTLQSNASSYTNENPTLVLETPANQDILMAVEFVNNGADFYGIDGKLIPSGTKFYVVAQLSAAAATQTESKVFKQDFTTTVKLNLVNLKNAYNVIPDLRSSKLELGFSVDLTWQAGHTYEINIQ